MAGVLLTSLLACGALSTLAVSSPTVTGVRLRTLCHVARLYNGLHTAQEQLCTPAGGLSSPQELQPLSSALVRDSISLARSLRSLSEFAAAPPLAMSNIKSLDALKAEAAVLHARIIKQDAELDILGAEGGITSSPDRAREMFAMLDSNSDGTVGLEEFVERATLLAVPQEKLHGTLEERFQVADLNRDGSLDLDEFSTMLSTLSRDALGPLRVERAGALARLLSVTLEMTSTTLALELDRASMRDSQRGAFTSPLRIDQLERCVDRWCVIGEKAELLALGALQADAQGAAARAVAAQATGVVAPTGVAAAASPGPTPAAQSSELELLLEQMGTLASELSMANVTTSRIWSVRKMGAQAVRQAEMALRFCWRGLRIFAGDVVECTYLTARLLRGQGLNQRDIRTLKRTATDAVALVPYTIIMVIPLSPPGHVFAFSLLNRCFPAAVPSAFTTQRQDIDEIYSRIAAEAVGAEGATERSRALKGLSAWGARLTRGVGARTKLLARATSQRLGRKPSGA